VNVFRVASCLISLLLCAACWLARCRALHEAFARLHAARGNRSNARSESGLLLRQHQPPVTFHRGLRTVWPLCAMLALLAALALVRTCCIVRRQVR
jgi:hypothetical protein